jgi:transcriptional regulator with XRE-family HTH domain
MKTCTTLEPKILGFWIRCIREAQHMSQDALAVSSGLDVRTIQRIEAGNAVSVTTRRCLARGLGYDNPDIFDDPEFAANVHSVLEGAQTINQEALDKQHPEHVRVKTERVPNGAALGRFADLANAVMLTADDDISPEAKRAAAALFDYIRDLLDIGDDASCSDKLEYHESLESMLRDLEEMGTAAYSAFRHVKLTGENWSNKTPLQLTIGYLTVVPTQKALDAMFVPRRVRLG